jgi:hypothetical protein
MLGRITPTLLGGYKPKYGLQPLLFPLISTSREGCVTLPNVCSPPQEGLQTLPYSTHQPTALLSASELMMFLLTDRCFEHLQSCHFLLKRLLLEGVLILSCKHKASLTQQWHPIYNDPISTIMLPNP